MLVHLKAVSAAALMTIAFGYLNFEILLFYHIMDIIAFLTQRKNNDLPYTSSACSLSVTSKSSSLIPRDLDPP